MKGVNYSGYVLPESDWTPTSRDIGELEKQVPQALIDYAGSKTRLPKPLKDYLRQYVGVWREGSTDIDVTFVCDAKYLGDHPERRAEIMGGGAYFMQGRYDAGAKRFLGLGINGPR